MDQLTTFGVVQDDARAPNIVFGRLKVRDRGCTNNPVFWYVAPSLHAFLFVQKEEVRAAQQETKRKLPPKRARKADEDDIMLEGDETDDDTSVAKSSAIRR